MKRPSYYLGNTGTRLMCLPLIAPVSRGQGILEPVRDDFRIDRLLQIEILPLVNVQLRLYPQLLQHILEEAAKEEGQQRPGQVQPLIAVMVAIVQLAAAQRGQQQPMHHVAEKVGLFRLAKLVDANVGQELLLEDFLRVFDAFFAGDAGLGAAGPDKVQRHVLLLDDKGLVQGRLDHLHHLLVLKVVDNVLENVVVAHEAQGTEDDDDGDLLLDVGQNADDPLPEGRLFHVLS